MKKKYSITIIGSGNVATHLGLALMQAGHTIVDVCSLNYLHAEKLAKALHANATADIKHLNKKVEIVIIAVNDDNIEKVAKKLPFKPALLLHTSGATDIKAISKYGKEAGVLYPLQTFSTQSKINFSVIPLNIEGSTKKALTSVSEIAKSLSSTVEVINSEQRRALHVAAIFACNFTNYMYSLSYQIMEKHGLNFEQLLPLIQETANKVKRNRPSEVQTGPAFRGDKHVMELHLDFLKKEKELKEVYKLVSASIRKRAKKKGS